MAKSREMGLEPAGEDPGAEAPVHETETFDVSRHPALHVVVERKGRGGKTATIIEGFECDDEQIKHIAKELKSTLGTGGSARGGEILIQGDCRERVRDALRSMGFKLKG